MGYTKRVFTLLLAVVAVAGLAACGSDDDSTTGGSGTITRNSEGNAAGAEKASGADNGASGGQSTGTLIVVRDGKPFGGVKELEYDAGEQVRFTVVSDVADEVHVHGYDLMEDLPAGGGSVSFDFPADIEGIFEVELEGRKEQIAELRVNP